MDTVLVTGGAGFIGSCFVRQVLGERNWQVVNLDRLTYAGNPDSLASVAGEHNHVFVEGDIADRAMVAEMLDAHRPAAIVNFAAESHVDRSIDGPREFLDTNVIGTFELLTAAREYWEGLDGGPRDRFRFLHVSTDEVYGSLGETGRFTETTPYAPNSPYSASKAASDHFVRAFHQTYGLPVLTTNCSNNYGPFQFPEKLIPLMILNALEGKSLPVYGDGKNIRDWLFVEDHCRAILEVLDRGQIGHVYNIGGDAEKANIDVVHVICDAVDRLRPDLPHRPCSSLIRFVKDRPGHDRRYAIDAGKIERDLGWTPTVAFQDGMEQTVRWYLENPEWVERAASGKYRRERLGLGQVEAPRVGGEAGPSKDSRNGKPPQRRIDGVVFTPLQQHEDARGWLVELYRNDEIPEENIPAMAYISQTKPGVVRGPHEHDEQSDYFAFIGPGDFRLFLWDARDDSPTRGQEVAVTVGESNPQGVIVPPGVVHAYKNLSTYPGWVINAPNRLYGGWGRNDEIDEIRHEHDRSSRFQVT